LERKVKREWGLRRVESGMTVWVSSMHQVRSCSFTHLLSRRRRCRGHKLILQVVMIFMCKLNMKNITKFILKKLIKKFKQKKMINKILILMMFKYKLLLS